VRLAGRDIADGDAADFRGIRQLSAAAPHVMPADDGSVVYGIRGAERRHQAE
jgi:hypothetical protein